MTIMAGGPAVGPEVDATDESGSAPDDRGFRPDVEGLRAVAVLLVVLYHANLPGLHGGFVGVDIFFVISGFVITGVLLREHSATKHTSLASFYTRRVRRILPAATVTIVATVLATYAVLGTFFGNPVAVAARWTAVFLANFHFASLGTDYLNAHQPPSPLQNFWSLAVEEQFYLVYPALFLIAGVRRSTRATRGVLAALLALVIVASFVLSVVQTQTSPDVAFFSPFTRAWELALGAVVCIATPALLRLPQVIAGVLSWVGLAAIGTAALVYSSSTLYPGAAVALPVIGAALVIMGGTPVPAWGAESVLRVPACQWLGRLSYSLYLWHWPILVIAAEAVGRSTLPFHQNLWWLALALVVSVATYRVIEDPVRHARALRRPGWLPFGLGAALVAASLLVATVALDLGTGARPNASRSSAVIPLTPAQVAQIVHLAPGIERLPGDLTPSLDRVQDDWGGPPTACSPDFSQTSVPACVFGAVHGSHTLVLYGDSHAQMWFASMDRVATASGWRLVVLGKGACPPVALPVGEPPGYGPPGRAFAQCAQWNQFALHRIRALHPDLVVISQDAELAPGGIAYPPDQWGAATEDLVRSLPVPATRVVIIGNIPQKAIGGPQCLSVNPTSVQQCSGPNDVAHFVDASAGEQRAAADSGARYIDVTPWFCSTTCTAVIGRYLPYWDCCHVTSAYSVALSQVLAESIDLASYARARGGEAGPGYRSHP